MANKKLTLLKTANYQKTIFLLSLVAITVVLLSCNKSDNLTQDLELRAKSLGFQDSNDYEAYVTKQCAGGNHENCCFLEGTHFPCPYPEHTGTRCDGSHRHGIMHGTKHDNCKLHNHCAHDPHTCTDPKHCHETCDPETCTDPTHHHGHHGGH